MRVWLARTLAVFPAVITGLIWFVAASRFMYRFGPSDAATAVGLMTGLAVALTMWRWTTSD